VRVFLPLTRYEATAWPHYCLNTERIFMGLILLIIVILMLVGGLPHWGYSRNWGYGPSGGLGLLLLIVLLLVIFNVIPRGF
jgi:hypothetical protein